MAEGGISLRSFHEPALSVNRLRESERVGEDLLGKQRENGFVYPPFESYPTPPDNNQVIEMPSTSREPDGSDDEEMAGLFSKRPVIVPSKSQVLFYLSSSHTLRLHKAGTEMQVTDQSNFPLFDVWAEKACCSPPMWVMESYGRRVLIVHESPRTWTRRGRRNIHLLQTVKDWNDECVGFFLPGDPFLIQNSSRMTIARCVSMDARREDWKCIMEENENEGARLSGGILRFNPDLGFQLKLLVLAAFTCVFSTPRSLSCFPFLR